MGQSTDAILFYGYCWEEETSRPWTIGADDDSRDSDDWETRLATVENCLPPSAQYPERQVTPTRENGWSSTPKDYSAAEQAIIDQHVAYWRKKREIAEASPCIVGTHCSGECPMPYVAVRVSQTIANRGYMKEISSLAIDPSWDDALADFCVKLGIRVDDKKPAWWLVSDWN